MSSHLGKIIRQARERYGLSQSTLALRAGTTQAVVSRIESGSQSPTFEMAGRLLLAMGEKLQVGSTRLEGRFDPAHLAAERALPADQRLTRAFAWSAFNDELRSTAARDSGT